MANNTPPPPPEHVSHKVFTYIEYRTVSGVFQTIDPPPLLPPHQRWGNTHSPGGGGVNISEVAKHWIGLWLEGRQEVGSLLFLDIFIFSLLMSCSH
jgi:hypothetical protein